MILRAAMLALAVGLAGCASDEARLSRLQLEQAMAYAEVLRIEQRLENLPRVYADPVERDARRVADEAELHQARNRLLLAERDLNRFLSR